MEGLLCDRVICVSEAVRKRLVSDYLFPAHKTVTIRNGIDLNRHGGSFHNQENMIRKQLQIQSQEPIVLCVARFSKTKRIDILLSAMSKVLGEYPSCKCVIVGKGRLEQELKDQAKELGISDSIRFTGYMEQVSPYYEAADIFVLSSLREGLPLVLLEAMAHGLPCIATDIAGNAEVIVHGETGLIVEPGNSEELAKAILNLLMNKELRCAMGINGKKRVEQHFDVNQTVARLKEVIFDGYCEAEKS